MATALAEITKKVQELSSSIGKESNSNQTPGLAVIDSSKVLATFQINNKAVSFVDSINGQVEVLLEQGDERISIKREDVEGIPDECFFDAHKMQAFLSQCYLKISEYSNNQGFKLIANLRLNGGGNIGLEIDFWPLANGKFVIPYDLRSSGEAMYAEAGKAAKERQSRNSFYSTGYELSYEERKGQSLLKDIALGKKPDLKEELNARDSIRKAIELWNKTGLVELIPLQACKEKYSDKKCTESWIAFETHNARHICESPCIGRGKSMGEQKVTCDIEKEGIFHKDAVQSMTHEIGHVIGLRHEHVRRDRRNYIATDYTEEGYIKGRDEHDKCSSVGAYDFNSVMHYALNTYSTDKGEYDFSIEFSERFSASVKKYLPEVPPPEQQDFLYKTFPDAKIGFNEHSGIELLNDLRGKIGIQPVVSQGDQDAVRELIKLARIEEARQIALKEEGRRKAEAEKAKRTSTSSRYPFDSSPFSTSTPYGFSDSSAERYLSNLSLNSETSSSSTSSSLNRNINTRSRKQFGN